MKKILLIILGILLAIVGFSLMVKPLQAVMVLLMLFAVSLFVNGISRIISYFTLKKTGLVSGWYLVAAIISVIFGAILLGDSFLNFAVNVALIYLIAVWFVIGGIVRIILAFDAKKLGDSNWWVNIIIGILFIICGILSFSNPAVLGLTLAMLLAINMFICGIDLVIAGFAIKE